MSEQILNDNGTQNVNVMFAAEDRVIHVEFEVKRGTIVIDTLQVASFSKEHGAVH